MTIFQKEIEFRTLQAQIQTLELSTTTLLTFADHSITLPLPCHTYIEFLLQQYKSRHTLIEGKPFTDNILWNTEYNRMSGLAELFGLSPNYFPPYLRKRRAAILSTISPPSV